MSKNLNSASKSNPSQSLTQASLPILVGANDTQSNRTCRTPDRAPVQRLALEPRIVFDGALGIESIG